jgi:hypothetical protein
MQTVTEALNLQKSQAELEIAMKTPGGIRITEEQEYTLSDGSCNSSRKPCKP